MTWPGSSDRGDDGISRRLPSLGLDFDRELEPMVDGAVLEKVRMRKAKAARTRAGKRKPSG